MKALQWFSISLFILLSGFFADAASMYDRKIPTGQYLFETLLDQGIPREPLDLVFRMFDYNQGRIPNTNYAVIVDYSLPSTQKRLYLMNFTNGVVERFYVSHGIKSGVSQTRSFSNLLDSWKSSIGFYFAKGIYTSQKNGLSLYLDGIDRSNNAARARNIVLHGAKYAGEDFITQNGRLGWSEGCFAVPMESTNYIINILQSGSIIFSYQKDLLAYSKQYPNDQELMGNEVIPPGVNTRRMPGEGGGQDLPANFAETLSTPALVSPLDL